MTVKNKERGEGGDAVHSTSKSNMARPNKMPAQQANRSEAKNTDCPFALEPKFLMKKSIYVIWKWENLKEILLILNFQK